MNDYKKRLIICLNKIYTNIFFYLSPLPRFAQIGIQT